MFLTVFKATKDSLRKAEYPMMLKDGEFMHKWVTSQMHSDRANEKILFMVLDGGKEITLVVQSKTEFPIKNAKRAGLTVISSMEMDSSNQDVIKFRVYCCPFVRIDGKDKALKDTEEKLNWISKKLSPFMTDLDVHEVGVKYVISPKKSSQEEKNKGGAKEKGYH